MDSIVDQYYLTVDELALVVEGLEETILQNPDKQIKGEIHNLKQESLVARRSVAPLREVVNAFDRLGNGIIKEDNLVFLRDLRDHVAQVTESALGRGNMPISLKTLA